MSDEDEVEEFVTIAGGTGSLSPSRKPWNTVSVETRLYHARVTAVLGDGAILAHSNERILHETRHWCLPDGEGVRWIHGTHTKDTVEGAALLVAFALRQRSE